MSLRRGLGRRYPIELTSSVDHRLKFLDSKVMLIRQVRIIMYNMITWEKNSTLLLWVFLPNSVQGSVLLLLLLLLLVALSTTLGDSGVLDRLADTSVGSPRDMLRAQGPGRY